VLHFCRSLATGPALAAEVRRSLAVYANQAGSPRPDPKALYLVGGDSTLAFALRDLDLPVHDLDPLRVDEKARVPLDQRSTLAGLLGLLQVWSRGQVPLNLVNPRKAAPVTDQSRRRRVLIGAGAFLFLLLAVVFTQGLLAAKKKEIQEVNTSKAELDGAFQRLGQDKLDIDALDVWEKGAIPWLDEFYDLAARFPQVDGFRLTRVQIEPIVVNSKNPERSSARMIMQGLAPAGKQYVHQFINSLRDPHLVANVNWVKGGQFSIQIDIARQPAAAYRTQLLLSSGGSMARKKAWR
jgi:hypothetical protein